MSSARDTPTTAATTPASHTALPDRVHELGDYTLAYAIAYGESLGYHKALAELAERADALDQTWRPPGRRDPEQVVADRIAEMRTAEGVDAWLDRYTAWSRRHDDEVHAAASAIQPAPCGICRPPAGVLCRCAGIVTHARHQATGRAA